ncbi:DUF808 domain-containing protein [Oricola cellulosilytica]|uniref:DUF808 domain-containing protein n=1 Tax=Oricola cellulosilytica TaxID=1429082 RepID=A0A4R0P5A5_9HYPH|nr:DUF808 domain-containing protein [Oricola cellulosilytica]TCD10988.1 DUF808 domain-containing protein [Oricola cellulosilytica]
MSGLLALLDDVAAIAKVAATSVDDVMTQAVKASAKASGAVIDDAAVTPKFIHGFEPARELPIVWKIAKGSFRNKLLILLPAALLLSAFAPWAIMPLLMLGGAYLCFEGAEKVVHVFQPEQSPDAKAAAATPENPLHLEQEKVAGAIKTDFILSAEIMTIILAAIPETGFWMEAATLAAAAVGITIAIYGSVALIVKADDGGLHMAEEGRFAATRALGRGIVKAMPSFLKLLTTVGTAAMLWVGGSIVIHGMESLGFDWLGHQIEEIAVAAGHVIPAAQGAVEWLVKATLDGIFGLALGLLLMPLANSVLAPMWSAVSGGRGVEETGHG